jgi:hypothetical protein
MLVALGTASLLLPALALAQYRGLRVGPGDPAFDTLQTGSALGSWQRLQAGQAVPQAVPYTQIRERDSQLGIQRSSGVYQPLSQRLSSLVETSHANMGDLGAEWSVLGQVGASLGAGWGVQAGVRHTETGLMPATTPSYAARAASAELGMLTLERNWDHFRGAYTFFGSYANTGAAGTGHRFDLQYYYSARGNVGLSYLAARPLQTALPTSPFQPLEGNHLGVTGEHWFSPAWAVNYRALVQDPVLGSGLKPQLRVGLRYTF